MDRHQERMLEHHKTEGYVCLAWLCPDIQALLLWLCQSSVKHRGASSKPSDAGSLLLCASLTHRCNVKLQAAPYLPHFGEDCEGGLADWLKER